MSLGLRDARSKEREARARCTHVHTCMHARALRKGVDQTDLLDSGAMLLWGRTAMSSLHSGVPSLSTSAASGSMPAGKKGTGTEQAQGASHVKQHSENAGRRGLNRPCSSKKTDMQLCHPSITSHLNRTAHSPVEYRSREALTREGAAEGRSACAWCTMSDSSEYSGCRGGPKVSSGQTYGPGLMPVPMNVPMSHVLQRQQQQQAAITGTRLPPTARTCISGGGLSVPSRIWAGFTSPYAATFFALSNARLPPACNKSELIRELPTTRPEGNSTWQATAGCPAVALLACKR